MPVTLPPSLVAITPGVLERDGGGGFTPTLDAMIRAARAAIAGGVRGLLVREPSLADGDLLCLARALRGALDEAGEPAWLGVHDRVHLARAAGADAAHVGGRSLRAEDARRVLAGDLALGASTHDEDESSTWSGADFALHAPVFAPVSKEATSEALGPEGLARFVARCDLPVWACGGITAERLDALEGSGARGVAAIGAVWGTDASPICGSGGPIAGVPSIEARSVALVRAVDRAFAGAPR